MGTDSALPLNNKWIYPGHIYGLYIGKHTVLVLKICRGSTKKSKN